MKKQISWRDLPQIFWQGTINFFRLVREAAIEFSSDNGLKLSASLSYYTLFGLAPMLIVVIAISSVSLGKEATEGYLYRQFEDLIGSSGALQLQEMILNAHISGDTPWVSVFGVVTLIFGATGIFAEIQDSINTIWSLKVKPKRSWLKYLQDRLLSFSLIVGLGFLLLSSLVISAMLNMVYDYLARYFGESVWIAWMLTNLLNVGAVGLLFAVVFKVLPDARLYWRDVLTGALFTTVLFLGGKWLVNIYLGRPGTLSVYGAAGALVIILLWVYYSSVILFFGAEFTKVYANKYGGKIRPSAYAVFVEKREVPVEKPVLQSEIAEGNEH